MICPICSTDSESVRERNVAGLDGGHIYDLACGHSGRSNPNCGSQVVQDVEIDSGDVLAFEANRLSVEDRVKLLQKLIDAGKLNRMGIKYRDAAASLLAVGVLHKSIDERQLLPCQ